MRANPAMKGRVKNGFAAVYKAIGNEGSLVARRLLTKVQWKNSADLTCPSKNNAEAAVFLGYAGKIFLAVNILE